MPKIWHLQPKINFASRIECRQCQAEIWPEAPQKWGQRSWVWVSEVKIIKTVVWCLYWQQVKVVDSLNHLKWFKNHECLKKWSYLWKGSILGSERSNGSRKIHVRDVEGPRGHPPQNYAKSIFPIDFFHALSGKTCCQKYITGDMVKIAIVKMASMKNSRKWKIRISVTQWLIMTDKQNLTIDICFCGWKMQWN